MSTAEEYEVTSLKVDLAATVIVKSVKHLVAEKKKCYLDICPSVLTLKLGFGTLKKGWLSLFILTKPFQTYFFRYLDLEVYHDGEEEAENPLAERCSFNSMIEDVRGRGWIEFLSLRRLTGVDELRFVLHAQQERKATSLPVQICHDPSLHPNKLDLLQDSSKVEVGESETDIEFVLGEKMIPAHKSILVRRSEYFRAMVESGLEESKSNKIKIDDDEGLFRILLNYWYSGIGPSERFLLGPEAWKLLELAHRYQVQDIVDQCEFAIRAKLKVDHVVSALLLAERYNCARLKEASADLIAKNIKDLRKTEDFAELVKHPKLMFDVPCASNDD